MKQWFPLLLFHVALYFGCSPAISFRCDDDPNFYQFFLSNGRIPWIVMIGDFKDSYLFWAHDNFSCINTIKYSSSNGIFS